MTGGKFSLASKPTSNTFAMKNQQKSQQRGFSMIELMVAVAVVGILASIALPQYSQYVQRGRRAEARTVLLQAGLAMQRFYAANDAYDVDRAGNAVLAAIPATLQQSPSDGSANYVWDKDVSTITATGFTLVFKPMNAMVGDKCGSFTLDQTGAKNVLNATSTRAECWR